MVNSMIFRLLVLFVVSITPLQKSFAGECFQEFMPNVDQVINDHNLGKYALGLSKKAELNGKVGVIAYGASTIKIKSAAMLRRYQNSAKMQAQKNFLHFVKKTSSTSKGMMILKSCPKTISNVAVMIVKTFTPL